MFAILSVAILAAATVWNGGLTTSQIAITLAAFFLQHVLIHNTALRDRQTTLEILGRNRTTAGTRRTAAGAVILAAVPAIATVDTVFAVAILGLTGLAYALPLSSLVGLRLRSRKIASDALKLIQTSRFDVVFYVAGTESAAYQINQWLPVAERLGLNACICLRRRSIYQNMTDTSLPVIHARRPNDAEKLLNSGVSVVLYPANPQENAISLRHFELQHYFINHGESDKIVNQSKFLMAYDKLLVAGPLAEQRLQNAHLPLRSGQVAQVGRPQVELLVKSAAVPRPIRRVLYAPTWEGFVDAANYSSVSDFGLAALRSILQSTEAEIVVKPHPYTGSRSKVHRRALAEIRKLAASDPRFTVIEADASIYAAMNDCDLMLADVGSVVNDFLASNKPIILCSTRGLDDATFIRQNPTAAATYILAEPQQAGALVRQIDIDDSMIEQRAEMRRLSLGHFPQGALARFREELEAGIATAKALHGKA